jgi:hypothetical protein
MPIYFANRHALSCYGQRHARTGMARVLPPSIGWSPGSSVAARRSAE